jgi:hypothetical protein
MYIEKRWLVPTLFTLLSAVALFVVFTLVNRPVETRTVERVVDVSPASGSCPATAASAPVTPSAAPVSTAGNQSNDGGFGDIGMQFQNVDVNAPITNVHISTNGDGNSTNVNVGQGNTITQTTPAIAAATSKPASTPVVAPPVPTPELVPPAALPVATPPVVSTPPVVPPPPPA